MSPAGAGSVRLSGPIALAYAAGDVGTSLTSVCLAFYWLYFLIAVAGLQPLTAGLIHGSGYVVSAAANLWAGRFLDRRVSDLRARCLLIAGLGAALAASFVLMWLTPPQHWRVAWYVVVSWAFHLIFSLVYLSYLSLAPRLGASETERVDLASYRFGGTMLLTLAILALHRATEGRWGMELRLLLLASVVAVCGVVGAAVCGLGLRGAMPAGAGEAQVRLAPWRALFGSSLLWRSVGANLAVWFMVQTTLVLTVFLCAAAGVADAGVLLILQLSIIVAAALTSATVRRIAAAHVLTAGSLLWCVGAALWWGGLAPYAAGALLGLGLGVGTVLSWSGVAEAVARFGDGRDDQADARAYAGLTVLRDLVSAAIPMLSALAMEGRAVGSAASGAMAAGLVIAAGVLTAALLRALRPLDAAGGGRG